MEIKKIHTTDAPEAVGPYTQAIVANGMVYTSGQIPLDPQTGAMAEGDIAAQTRRVMENLRAVLTASGSDLSLAVKTTCFLADMGDFAAFNTVYGEYFTEKPARSCVQAAQLPKGARVEVEVIALVK